MCAILSEESQGDKELWKLELCNQIGSPLDTKYMNFEPLYSSMTRTHIVASSNDYVYVWQYRNQVARLTTFESSAMNGVRKLGRDIAWFVDDVPDTNLMYDREVFQNEKQTEDIICAIYANESFLLVGRLSGTVMRFTLPHISVEPKQFLQGRPQILLLNCTSTRLACIDSFGTLNLLEVTAQGG